MILGGARAAKGSEVSHLGKRPWWCVFLEKNGFMQSGSGSELGARPFVYAGHATERSTHQIFPGSVWTAKELSWYLRNHQLLRRALRMFLSAVH